MHAIQIIAINSLKSSSLEILGDAIRNDIEKLTSSILVAEKHALLLVLYIPIFSIQSKYVGRRYSQVSNKRACSFIVFGVLALTACTFSCNNQNNPPTALVYSILLFQLILDS